MPPDHTPQLNAELLDDFFSECDEHLSNIRHALTRLESFVGQAQADSAIIEDLFRNFHSFKGISALVGVGQAEQLAHGAEDFLRSFSRGGSILREEGLELLMTATQRLEHIVAAFREGKPLPAVEPLLGSIQKMAGMEMRETDVAISAPAASDSSEASEGTEGQVVWKCTFVPTRDLEERGITLGGVRKRLNEAGTILRESSRVRGAGEVVFEFMLATPETPADIANWEAEGIAVELVDPTSSSPALPDEPSKTETAHTPFLAPSHVVRVDLSKLDDLMRITGDMVVARSRFADRLSRAEDELSGGALEDFQEVNTAFSRSLRELRQAIMRVRLVPVAEVFARLPFVVRDLARDSHKQADLRLEGQQTELDKYLIERLKDPLLHLVRNAFSHGVESPEERSTAGKPAKATITVKASTMGDSVLIQVSDDGRGVDTRAVIKRARNLGLEAPDRVDAPALLKLLCSPGFSTRDDADRASGRGVGMAVVYNTIRELGGNITLETKAGKGTQFTLRLPLTLAISESFIVQGAGQTCAIPQNYVSEVIQVMETTIQRVNRVEVVPYRSGLLPITRLSALFGLPSTTTERTCVLVLSSERGSTGLVVDRVQGQREVVVRAIRDPLVQVAGVIGATELGDGRPVLILDGELLTSGAVRPHQNNGNLEPAIRIHQENS